MPAVDTTDQVTYTVQCMFLSPDPTVHTFHRYIASVPSHDRYLDLLIKGWILQDQKQVFYSFLNYYYFVSLTFHRKEDEPRLKIQKEHYIALQYVCLNHKLCIPLRNTVIECTCLSGSDSSIL